MTDRRELANAIRFLAMDAVQKANSGHPGMPMGMADIAEVLWRDYLQFNPQNPKWFNRDRFVLSNGHGALLLYSVLHLTGYALSIEDLKQFRQLDSKTPGHPEYHDTPGVETTTGPLGQGLANAVGMAIAEKQLALHFNEQDHTIVDHYTYAFVGDGCLMEGISHEACSLAGTLGLGKLIVFYDDNGISIDGDVSGWFTDNTPQRFEAYHWHVIPNVDGHDAFAIKKAIEAARVEKNKPTLICCKTKIGYGAPTKEGQESTHGAPLGDAEIAGAREKLGWPYAPFEIPDAIYQAWDARDKGHEIEEKWNRAFSRYESAYPEKASEFLRRIQGWLPIDWKKRRDDYVASTLTQKKSVATRKASQQCLNAFAPSLPELIGGSADLTGSNCTDWSGTAIISKENPSGNYIEYGVREFGMAAVMNGLALHGGFIPYGGTFLVFTDYARNAIRLSALMKQKVIYVLTHDSIGLGEDGPTHQPIEHAAMLRMTPHLHVWRPCDLTETAVAWAQALEYHGPSCLLLSRQNIMPQSQTSSSITHINRGAYVLYQTNENKMPDGIYIATGSEVELAMTAAHELSKENFNIRVVSMPCADIYKQQDANYQEHLLPRTITVRVAVEAGVSDYWYQFIGLNGRVVGIDRFGASAPAEAVYRDCRMTVAAIKQAMLDLLKNDVKIGSL